MHCIQSIFIITIYQSFAYSSRLIADSCVVLPDVQVSDTTKAVCRY